MKPKFEQEILQGTVPHEAPAYCYTQEFEPDWAEAWSEAWTARTVATVCGMWGIVDLKWTQQLANWIGNRRVLEVMSGVGWLAAALRHYKVDLVATDSGEWQPEIQVSPLTEVLRVDAVTAINHFEGSDLLLISWPPSDLQLMQEIATAWGVKPIIYIGEQGGVNAPKHFFERFVIDSSIQIENPKWFGMNDQVFVGTYQS